MKKKHAKTLLTVTSFLSLATLAVSAVAQTTWEPLNGPHGAWIADIDVDTTSPGTVYTATNFDGVYISTNSGITWTPRNKGLAPLGLGGWDLVIHPANSEILYLGAWVGGLYRSTNKGETWENLFTPPGGCAHVLGIAIFPKPIDQFFQIYIPLPSDCIYKSTDSGGKWVKENNGFPPNMNHWAVAINQTNPNLVYAVGQTRADYFFYKSTDGAKFWMNKSDGLKRDRPILAISLHPSNENIIYLATEAGVYKTVNGAESWFPINSGLTNIFTRDLVMDVRNSETLYVATWNGLFKTTNAGGSWFNVSSGFVSQIVRTVDMDPSNSRNIYAGVWGGIQKSTDGGATWSFSDTGLPQGVVVADNGVVVDPTNRLTIYVATFGGGVAKSVDGGQSFNYINNGIEMPFAHGLYMFPDDPQTIFCYVRGTPILYKTTDGGKNWFESNSGLPNTLFFSGAFDPSNSDIFYFATIAGVYKTIDRGNSWFSVNTGLPDLNVRGVAIDPTASALYVATRDSGLFKSSDGGLSWSAINNGITDLRGRSVAVDPSQPLVVFAGTQTGVFRSSNGGGIWSKSSAGIEDNEVQRIAINPRSSSIVYAQTRPNGMFRSVDGGLSWKPFNEGVTSVFAHAMAFDHPKSPNYLYIGTGNGVFRHDLITTSVRQQHTYASNVSLKLVSANPNPFNPTTKLTFTLPSSERVRLHVYNTLGHRVRTLIDREMTPGQYLHTWDGRTDEGTAATSGIYFVYLGAGRETSILKIALVR